MHNDYKQISLIFAALSAATLLASPYAFAAESFSGTAFEVSDTGDFLTNRHVVADCKSIRLRRGALEDAAQVVALDADKDLALLVNPSRLKDRIAHRRMTGGASLPYAHFPEERAYLLLGQSVVTVGFPLPSYIGGINVTSGIVSATTGPNNDAGLFQITAPVQGGNSGGPVLDANGTVIGVVVSQLDPIKMEKLGVIPQNVNFAIQGKVARDFVRKSTGTVTIDEGVTSRAAPDTATIANYAAQYTYQVLCLN